MASLLFGLGIVMAAWFACVEGSDLDKMIDMINSQNLTWKAGRNFHPDTTLEYLKGLCGTRPSDMSQLPVKMHSGKTEIPDEFDARKHWPNCPTISHILNQGACGSCWAFGTTAALSDRLCIATNASFTLPLSEDDITTCNGFGMGCKGGSLLFAWVYFTDPGVVTGGDHKSNMGCRTYEIPPCDSQEHGPLPLCPNSTLPTPNCEWTCNNKKYAKPYNEDKHKVDIPSVTTYNDVKAAQEDLLKHGPISTGFSVYTDFFHYKSGVYQTSSSAKYLGGHAVRVIGWGTENGTPYWLVANSWNGDWGDKGLFKILRGADECGIESGMIAGLPLLE